MNQHPVVPACIAELIHLMNAGILSEIQVSILFDRHNQISYEQIIHKYKLSGPGPLVHSMVRTSMTYRWDPGMTGGGDSYLPPADELRFHNFVLQACDSVNCICCNDALTLALNLQKERTGKAVQILVWANSTKLISHLPSNEPPSRPWLNSILDVMNVKLLCGQDLEIARRVYCDRNTIIKWFLDFNELFKRNKMLMYNMDETQVSSKKRLKALCPKDRECIRTALPWLPHITGMVTVNGVGKWTKPILIIPKKKTLRTLEEFTEMAYFASSTSGWVTKNIYRYFAITFISEISFHRLRMPSNLRDEPILLFVDGHGSRWDFKANLIFWLYNVDVLSFPGHCSHLLQMFDICLAGPLKTTFKQEIIQDSFDNFLESLNMRDLKEIREKISQELRKLLIISFITAMEKVFTSKNCIKSFEKAGVSPYNPMIPLESHYAMEPPDGIYGNRTGKASARFLTSEESLKLMFFDENGRDMTRSDLLISIKDIMKELKSASLDDGIPLTGAPDVILPIPTCPSSRILKMFREEEL